MQRFYWVDEGMLAGSSRPGMGGSLRADLDFLRSQGIAAVLSLTETPLDRWMLAEFGIDSLHLPIADMTAPQPVHFREALAFIDDHHAARRAVLVHCLMGQGRTGSILGSWLIRAGATAERALAEIREICPGAVENDDQEAALRQFALARSWII
ncbi:MAG: dual specificity protein phosphatase family protein [Thermomicrobiales bacterium]